MLNGFPAGLRVCTPLINHTTVLGWKRDAVLADMQRVEQHDTSTSTELLLNEAGSVGCNCLFQDSPQNSEGGPGRDNTRPKLIYMPVNDDEKYLLSFPQPSLRASEIRTLLIIPTASSSLVYIVICFLGRHSSCL
jgi:hypothetical protein